MLSTVPAAAASAAFLNGMTGVAVFRMYVNVGVDESWMTGSATCIGKLGRNEDV